MKQEKIAQEMEEREKALDEINNKYEKLKVLLEQKEYARTRRQNSQITYEMINNRISSVIFRCKRYRETRTEKKTFSGVQLKELLDLEHLFEVICLRLCVKTHQI